MDQKNDLAKTSVGYQGFFIWFWFSWKSQIIAYTWLNNEHDLVQSMRYQIPDMMQGTNMAVIQIWYTKSSAHKYTMEMVCTATHCGRSPRRLNRAGRLLGKFQYQRTHFYGDVNDGGNVYVDDGAED